MASRTGVRCQQNLTSLGGRWNEGNSAGRAKSEIRVICVDPDGSFHQVMYDIYMGGATPPPEPGAERLIVRMRPDKVYIPARV